MKFKASVEAQVELAEYCKKHGDKPLKRLLNSTEYGDEGALIMYKYMPKMARAVMSQDNYLKFFNKNKQVILEHMM